VTWPGDRGYLIELVLQKRNRYIWAESEKGLLMDEGHLIFLTLWFDPLELAARQGKMANNINPYTYRDLGFDFGRRLRIEAVGIFKKDSLERWRDITDYADVEPEKYKLRQNLKDFVSNEFPSLMMKVPREKQHEFLEGVCDIFSL
jgi:hypothetical protein